MKKLTFFCAIILLIIVTGCKSNNTINKEEFELDFSLSQMLPESIKEVKVIGLIDLNNEVSLNKYHSESFYKMAKAYEYIDELITSFKNDVNNAIKVRKLQLNKNYQKEGYTYVVNKNNNQYKMEIKNANKNQVIEINIDKAKKIYEAKNIVNKNTLTFTIIDNKELTLKYDNDLEKAISYSHLVKESEYLKSNIIFNNNIYSYQLVSLATKENSAIYSNFDTLGVNSEYFEVYDDEGYLLYQSVNLFNDSIKFSGWHMHALEGFKTIEQVSELNYKVDNQSFGFKAGDVNLHHIELRYLKEKDIFETSRILILGKLEFFSNITNIVSTREPFKTKYYEIVSKLAFDIKNYYNELKNNK